METEPLTGNPGRNGVHNMSPHDARYFYSWMLLRVYDLIDIIEKTSFIPSDGPVSFFGMSSNGRVRVRFSIEYVDGESPPPVQLPPSIVQLTETEQAIERATGYDWTSARTIARKAGYKSNSYVRGIISRLCLLERLERGPRGTYRRKRQA